MTTTEEIRRWVTALPEAEETTAVSCVGEQQAAPRFEGGDPGRDARH